MRLAAEILEALPAHVGMRCYVKLSECRICGDHMLDGVYDVRWRGKGESNVKKAEPTHDGVNLPVAAFPTDTVVGTLLQRWLPASESVTADSCNSPAFYAACKLTHQIRSSKIE